MPVKKIILVLIGFALVICGVAVVLKNWFFVQMVFWGVIGPILAIAGLVVLTIARD